jgi:hypothetical protein
VAGVGATLAILLLRPVLKTAQGPPAPVR